MFYNKEDVKGKIRDLFEAYPRFNKNYWLKLLEQIEEHDEESYTILYEQLNSVASTLEAVHATLTNSERNPGEFG